MTQRTTERLGGLFLALLSGGFLARLWYTAIYLDYTYPTAAAFFTAFLIFGAALLIFPSYRLERAMRGGDLSKLSGLKLITPRWWIILVLALFFALLTNFALRGWI